jgi:hypothetical protein
MAWVIPPHVTGFISRIFLPAGSRRLRIKKSRSAEAQIIGVLREAEGGVPMAELCRKYDMSSASLL